jgi:hypothetical protein
MKILENLKKQVVLEKINNYNNKQKQHVSRIHRSRHKQPVMKYRPAGKRKPGLPA